MEKWYNRHQGAIFLLCVSASVFAYAYTNFSTKTEVATQIASVKEPLSTVLQSMDKRLERIEDAIYKQKENK